MREQPPHKTAPLEGFYLDVHDAAAYLGIATRTLRRWTAERRFECVRIGKLTKYTKAALDRFMQAHTIAPGKRR